MKALSNHVPDHKKGQMPYQNRHSGKKNPRPYWRSLKRMRANNKRTRVWAAEWTKIERIKSSHFLKQNHETTQQPWQRKWNVVNPLMKLNYTMVFFPLNHWETPERHRLLKAESRMRRIAHNAWDWNVKSDAIGLNGTTLQWIRL